LDKNYRLVNFGCNFFDFFRRWIVLKLLEHLIKVLEYRWDLVVQFLDEQLFLLQCRVSVHFFSCVSYFLQVSFCFVYYLDQIMSLLLQPLRVLFFLKFDEICFEIPDLNNNLLVIKRPKIAILQQLQVFNNMGEHRNLILSIFGAQVIKLRQPLLDVLGNPEVSEIFFNFMDLLQLRISICQLLF
jgi:hypothetical protein